MKEHPIIFGTESVRAILDGRKTQTRRVLKPQPSRRFDRVCPIYGDPKTVQIALDFYNSQNRLDHAYLRRIFPYGKPGDRLWVRETWMPDAPQDATWADVEFYGCERAPLGWIPEHYRKSEYCLYRADYQNGVLIGWRPSVFMPRWASRITLEITSVTIERLQSISQADAAAEGWPGGDMARKTIEALNDSASGLQAVEWYIQLWDTINAKRSYAWETNPWVWVMAFKVVEVGG